MIISDKLVVEKGIELMDGNLILNGNGLFNVHHVTQSNGNDISAYPIGFSISSITKIQILRILVKIFPVMYATLFTINMNNSSRSFQILVGNGSTSPAYI